MTVSSSTNVVILSADGSTHSFSFTFKIFAASDLKVIVRSAAGVETEKTLDSHYIIPTSSVGNTSGGNILFKFNTGTSSDAHYSTTDFRPANGEKVILRRQQPQTQELDLVDNDPFSATLIEEQFDKVVMQIQGVQEAVDRSLKFSRSNLLDSSGSQIGSTYPEIEEDTTARANKVLSFDSTGTPIATQEIGTLRGDWAASTAYQERDIVKDTSTSNHFIVNTAHTSSGSQPLTTNTNSSKYTAITNFSGATLSPGQLVVDNITIDGNTISTTNSNGDLILTPNGTGNLHVDGEIKVEGNDISEATNFVTISPSSTGGDDIFLEGVNAAIAFYDTDTGTVPRYGQGSIFFYGKNASGNFVQVGSVEGYQSDATDGSVDGGVRFTGTSNNSTAVHASISGLSALLIDGLNSRFGGTVTIEDKLIMADVTSGKILIADGASYEEQAVSGDITINSSGVTAISSGVIVNADISGSAAIADSKLATITTADKVSGAAIQIDGATDGTSITVADADKLLIDDGGTTKYINASQLNTYISVAASSVAADNITAGDAAVTLTTTSGNITIDAQASNSNIILKGTDGSTDTTYLTISGGDAGAATFNSTVTATGFIIGSANINENDLEAIDGITAGTGAASKAVVLDSSSNVNNIGTISATNLNISNDVDVDGTLEADAITINGTAISSVLSPVAGHASIVTVGALDSGSITSGFGNINNGSSTITTTGAITGGSLTADGITIDGQAITTTSGDLTIEAPHAASDIILDCGDVIILDADDNGQVFFKDGGTTYGSVISSSGELVIQSGSTPTTAVTFSGANATFAGTVASTGVLTANAGVVVDNITIDGTEIDLSSGSLTIDVAANIILDSDSGEIQLKDNGAEYVQFKKDSDNVQITAGQQDGDIVFRGNDGGSMITALTLDISEAGDAQFNRNVGIGGTPNNYSGYSALTLNHATNGGLIDLELNGNLKGEMFLSSSGFHIKSMGSDEDLLFQGNDGGSSITALTLDMSAAGAATFNSTLNTLGTIGAPKGVFTSSNAGQVTLNSTSSDYMLEFQTNGTSEWWIRSSAASWKVAENGVGDHLTILASNGNVGIGTTSPSQLMEISSSSAPKIRINNSSTSLSANTSIGGLEFNTNDASSGGTGIGASIEAKADGNFGSDQQGVYLAFSTRDSGSGETNTERMKIGKSGEIQIGGASSAGFIDFDGTNLQLNTQRNPNTGTFVNTSRSHAAINLKGSDGGSSIEMRTHGANNANATAIALTIDSSQNVLVGRSALGISNTGHTLAAEGYAEFTRNASSTSVGASVNIGRNTSDGKFIDFFIDGATKGYISYRGAELQIGQGNAALQFSNGSDAIVPANESGTANDDAIDLGISSGRFDNIFATNGTIQTSDENEKQDIASMTTAELAVGKRLSTLFKTFRWKDKVTEKADKARTHSGIIAQEVKAAFEAEGLDATKYALFCSDTWWEKEISVDAVEADEEKGIEAKDAYTYMDIKYVETEGYSEKTRLGVRYPELLSFIASYNESRFTAIEARLTALEGG